MLSEAHRIHRTRPQPRIETEPDYQSLVGKVVEVSGYRQPAGLSLAATLIRDCQKAGREAAWIAMLDEPDAGLFYPPDFRDCGILCERIPLVSARSTADSFALAHRLLRSGAFGMIVIDLTAGRRRKIPGLGGLQSSSSHHHSLVLCLTDNPPGESSIDPMVFARLHVSSRPGADGDRRMRVSILKDKTGSSGRVREYRCAAPAGLC